MCADRRDAYDAASVALLDHLTRGRLCRPKASFDVGVDVGIERVLVKPAITLDCVTRYIVVEYQAYIHTLQSP